MKKIGYILGIASLTLVLAACGNNADKKTDSENSTKDSYSAKMQNNSSTSKTNKNQSSTNNSGSANNASSKADLSNYQYSVPKKDTKKANYVKTGNLAKPRQFTFDRFGTRQQLTKINQSPKSMTADGLTYQITKVRVVENSPKTEAAKQAAAQTLNLQSVPSKYYTFVINYSVTNNRNSSVALNGINNIKTNKGQTLTTASQLSDSSAGNHLTKGQSKTFVSVGYLHNYATQPTTKVTMNFGAIYDLNGKQLAAAPNQGLLVSLN